MKTIDVKILARSRILGVLYELETDLMLADEAKKEAVYLEVSKFVDLIHDTLDDSIKNELAKEV